MTCGREGESDVKTKILGLLAAGLLAATPVSAGAASLYSNFGASDSYISTAYLPNLGNVPPNELGFQFTATSTGAAASFDATIQRPNGPSGPVTVDFGLYADNAGTLGALLESFNVTSTGSLSSPAIATSVLSGTTLLAAGNTYWILGGVNTSAQWYWSWSSVTGNTYYDGSYIGNEVMGAFRINSNSTAVPEPGTLALLGLGLAGLGLSRRRKAN